MSLGGVRAAVAAVRAAFDELAASEVDLLTAAELVDCLDELETLGCQLPSVSYRMLARLQTETTAPEMGAKNWAQVLAVRWRISPSQARRRLTETALLAPRRSVTGEPLPPELPATSVAAENGLITGEHVEVIGKAMDKLPSWVDAVTREQFEVDLVRSAVGHGPRPVADAAARALFLLDQDGPEPDDTDRARTRAVTVSRQRADGMVDVRATLTPEAWAVWEAIFARYAAPGMGNPDDPTPCISGTPSHTQIEDDQRSLAQRQHDGLLAAGRIALMSGGLGRLNGLPVSVIVRTTLQDLESRAGVGTTAGGTIIPIAEVIRMGAHASHYLAVFDRATGSALDLFRTRRVASPAQRVMLIARDGGCTTPGCTVGAYGCQVHHVTADWVEGGNTNVDELGLACGPDNRAVGPGGWTTTINGRGEVEWTPPAPLDTGQTRINTYHQPERLLQPREPDEGTADPASDTAEPAGPAPPNDQAA